MKDNVPYFRIDPRTLDSAEVEAESLEQFADSKKHFAEITANDFVANEARNEARCLAEKALSIREAISEARENGSIPLTQAKTIWEAAGKYDRFETDVGYNYRDDEDEIEF